ncbi:ABC transporter substrate-binding protein [Glutamicibacter endophyticus]|uniref:ABC transporter substrate-binding protein n=1 Tax=Glutamicibacter endophyticus TaxID=1522174 RepID=UPI003AF0882B
MFTRTRTRLVSGLALIGLMPMALTGCFSSSQASAEQESEQRISLAMLQPPRSGLSPLSDDAFKLSRWNTAETLTVLNEQDEAEPKLASAVNRVDERTWSFTIRDGVSFHDGTELTAEVAAAALQHAVDATPQPRILDGVELSIRTEGDKLLITTAQPDPLLSHRFSSPQLSILSPAAYTGQTVNPVGTGTGPYELVASNGTSSATLNRFEKYWGEPAAAAGLDVHYVPDGTARAAALRTGEADIVEAIPVGQAAQIDPSLIFEVPMPRTNTLYLNTESGPFKDPAVRAAAREAIDRARIVADVYEQRADQAAGLLGPALPWVAAEREAAAYQQTLNTRPAAAKVDGAKIKLGTFTDRAELPEVAVLIEQQLEAAGFEVTQDVREYQYIEADALEGKFDAFILSRATVLDSGDPVAYMYSDFACKGSFNISQLCDKDIDRALAEASAAAPGAERRAAIARAESLILASDAAIPMLHERVIQGERQVRDAVRDPRERALVSTSTAIEP